MIRGDYPSRFIDLRTRIYYCSETLTGTSTLRNNVGPLELGKVKIVGSPRNRDTVKMKLSIRRVAFHREKEESTGHARSTTNDEADKVGKIT